MNDIKLDSKTKPITSDRIHELQEQITELKKRWPAHSIPPAMLQLLDELDDELEDELKKNKERG
jgi:hypothetical protein